MTRGCCQAEGVRGSADGSFVAALRRAGQVPPARRASLAAEQGKRSQRSALRNGARQRSEIEGGSATAARGVGQRVRMAWRMRRAELREDGAIDECDNRWTTIGGRHVYRVGVEVEEPARSMTSRPVHRVAQSIVIFAPSPTSVCIASAGRAPHLSAVFVRKGPPEAVSRAARSSRRSREGTGAESVSEATDRFRAHARGPSSSTRPR